MLSAILGILFLLSTTACGLVAKQNYRLKINHKRLENTLLGTMGLETDEFITETHDYGPPKKETYTLGGGGTDNILVFRCQKCDLTKCVWEGSWGPYAHKGKPLDGFFRFSKRLDEQDDSEIPCKKLTPKWLLANYK